MPRLLGFGVAVLLLADAARVTAQPVFDAVTRASGLPSDYVNAIHQDRYGLLWFGTDAGLARYDGQRVETFTADDGLPHPFVYAVQEDRDGTLWVGTFSGLARFDGAQFAPVEGVFDGELIAGLGLDGEGRLLASSSTGLGRHEGGRWRVAAPPEGVSWSGVVALPDGRLLGGGLRTSGVAALFLLTPEGDGFNATALDLPWDAGRAVQMAREASGTVLVHTGGPGGRLRRLRIDGRDVAVVASAPVGALRLMAATPSGGAVASVEGGDAPGVYRLDADLERAETPLHPGPAQALTVDYEGSLWLGTFGDGALRVRAEALNRLVSEPATRLALGSDGTLWATGDGLWRVDAKSDRVERVYAGRALREVQAAPDGTVWLSDGPTLFRGVSRAGAPLRPFWSDAGWISGVDASADTVHVSAYGGGIVRVEAGRAVDSLREGRELPTDMVESLRRTRGALWALTRSHGALRIEAGRVEVVGRERGLPSSAVYSVYEASDGATWFGTDRGVARLAPGAARAEAFGQEPLRGQRVAALFEREGLVWFVGERTLYVIDEGRIWAAEAVSLLPDPESSINDAVYDARTGRLVLATTSDVVAVDLAALPSDRRPPPRIAIRGVQVGDAQQALVGNPLAARIAPIVPGRHRVEVALAPLSFATPVRTEVRLNGGAWTDIGQEARVVFPALGAGDHVLAVRAVAGSDRASTREATLAFSIRPHWWQRPIVVALLGLLGMALLVTAVRYVSQRRLRARVRALEVERRLHDERERISRDLHDHVGAQLSSLLAGVELARLAKRASGDGGPPLDADPLDGVEADARTTMRQLRETIWALHGASVSLDAFAARVRQDLAARRSGLETTVECTSGADQTLSPVQALNLFRITQEGITNALKHAGAERLDVTVGSDGATVRVEVRDDGTFRTPTGGDGLSGFGLRSMRARASALGGRVELLVDDGTTVRVEVPAEAVDA